MEWKVPRIGKVLFFFDSRPEAAIRENETNQARLSLQRLRIGPSENGKGKSNHDVSDFSLICLIEDRRTFDPGELRDAACCLSAPHKRRL